VPKELKTGPLEYATERKAEILNELIAFARIPSVSTDPAYLQGIASGAEWVAERMRRAGLENVQINPTSGHPVVTCDWLHAEGAPTILIYGHYDVQPPDPLEKWKSKPFEPEVHDNRLYARGVSDDKGPMLIPIKTAEAYLKTQGKLPINVKFVIEGDEERGSAPLGAFVASRAAQLKADFVLSADGAMWRPDEPSITVANRGLAALEFTVTVPPRTCIPAGMAGASTIRWRRSRGWQPACMMIKAVSRSPASMTACGRPATRRGGRWPTCRSAKTITSR